MSRRLFELVEAHWCDGVLPAVRSASSPSRSARRRRRARAWHTLATVIATTGHALARPDDGAARGIRAAGGMRRGRCPRARSAPTSGCRPARPARGWLTPTARPMLHGRSAAARALRPRGGRPSARRRGRRAARDCLRPRSRRSAPSGRPTTRRLPSRDAGRVRSTRAGQGTDRPAPTEQEADRGGDLAAGTISTPGPPQAPPLGLRDESC